MSYRFAIKGMVALLAVVAGVVFLQGSGWNNTEKIVSESIDESVSEPDRDPIAVSGNATGTTSSVAFSNTPPLPPKKIGTPVVPVVATPANFKRITMGVVVNESEIFEDRKEHEPLVRYLAKKLAGGEEKGKLILSQNVIELAEQMRRGEIDLFIDTPFSSAIMRKLAGATIIAARAKGGVDTYRSYIFVRTDSGITKLSDLVGKKIAFESPDSTSNYFLPLVELTKAGLKVKPLDKDGKVQPGTVGYYFTGDDAIIIPDVLRGEASAGGRNSVSYIKETSTTGTKLRILSQTPKVYRSITLASPKLSDAQITAIKDILFAMDKSEEGRKVLLKSGKTLYFKAVSPLDQEFIFMQQLAKEVDDEIISSSQGATSP